MLLRNAFKSSKNASNVGVILVSGCDSGLGFSLARHCKSEGLRVIAGCLQPGGEGAQKLNNLGVDVLPLDVTKRESIKEASSTVEDILRRDKTNLHAVVNNAGVLVFGEFEWQTLKQMETQISVNLHGYFNMAHEFLPLLQRGEGRLMNIVSHCALAGLPGLSVYGATKAAILNWSDTLRIEQRKYGVKVISVIPGSFFGESNIMRKQAAYATEMINEMSTEKRQFHEQYFNTVQTYLAQLPQATEARSLTDEVLHNKLMHGLLSTYPKTIYKHEPWRYTIYHTLFKLFPVSIRDRLVEHFVKLPNYPKSK